MSYDTGNIFAKILRGEIPSTRLYEDEWAVAFADIRPLAPSHILVIPKGEWVGMADFTAGASAEQIAGFFRAVGKVASAAGLDTQGYRLIVNQGADANQEVPHLHVHVLGGANLGRMLDRPG